MELNVVNGSKMAVAETVFGQDFNESLIHQVVVAYLAGARAGTKAQKTRAEVRGGGIKPWRQKGTGRARAGSIRSPLWRSGGKSFAAKPRDYSQKVNRKMYDGALRSIMSELVRQERLVVVQELSLAEPKTKELVAKLKDLSLNHVLIVSDAIDANLLLAARNLVDVHVSDVSGINPAMLIAFDKVLMTSGAVKSLEEKLS